MKILHTSDWHIGSTWEGIDRSEDLLDRAVPDLVEIALKEKVDILLVTGDIFERQTNEALEKAAQTLREPFRELLNAHIDVALLPGNHDSYPLFRFLRSAVELVGDQENDRGQLYILNSLWITQIRGLQITHLPYLRPEQIEKSFNERLPNLPSSIEISQQELGRKLDQIAQYLRSKMDHNSPSLMAYHGVVRGSTLGSDEQAYEFTYHQDYMLSPESLLFNDLVPSYNALGHIHKCQDLNGAVPTWYAGSIDRLDRGERTYLPSIMLVNYSNKNRKVEVDRLPLPRPTPFLDEDIKNEEQLKALCDKLGTEGCKLALGRITLSCDPVQVYILDRAVRDAFPRLKGIRGAVKRSRNMITEIDNSDNVINLKELINPVHTIRNYISKKLPKEQQEGLFNALAIVEDELDHDN
jgi:exonuclease SbcD